MSTIPTSPSLIPKEATSFSTHVQHRQKGMADLLSLIAIVLFIASIALATGVFLYKEYLNSSVASKVTQLERVRTALEPSLIHELVRFDDRMRAASDVLGAHISATAFLRMLELNTVVNIVYNSLDFEAVDPQNISIKMGGVAGSINAIAFQADIFAKVGMITSPIFSNINRDPDGIHFSLSALVNPAEINYAQIIGSAESGGSAAPKLDDLRSVAPPKSDADPQIPTIDL